MSVEVRAEPRPAAGVMMAAARLARGGVFGVRVVVPRRPGAVRLARAVAEDAGLELVVDLRGNTIGLRYVGPRKDGTEVAGS